MDNNTCKDCKLFIQHYALVGGKLFDVWCGHCVKGRVRHRKPDEPACEAFAAGKTEWERAVPKEDPAKAVLDYLLEKLLADKESPCP